MNIKTKSDKILESGIYLTFFLLPVYLIRFSIFGIPTNLLEIIISLVLLFWLLKYSRSVLIKWSTNASWKIFWPAFLILTGLILSMLVNNNYLKGLGIIKGWFVFPLIIFFLTSLIITINKRENIFQAYYLSALSVALISLFYYLFGEMTYDGRLQAFYNSPNYLAMYLAPAIVIGLILFSNWPKFYGITLGIIGLALYLTFSYAAWIALLLSLIVILVFNNQFPKKIIWIFSLIILAFIFFQIRGKKVINLFENHPRSSWTSRIIIWQSARKILSDHWLLGIGPGNFQDQYLEYQKHFTPYLEWAVPQPHNLYLAFWLQTGLIGLIGFLSLLYIWFRQFFSQKPSRLAWIGLGIIFYILLHGLVDTSYFKNDLAIIFWMVFLAI